MILFRFILLLFLIYLIITSVRRFLFGTQKSSFSGREEYEGTNQRREGDISVQVGSKNKKKFSKETGEYVNFEEVKDE
jgi:hypothetical protein